MLSLIIALLSAASPDTASLPDHWGGFEPVAVRPSDPAMSSLDGRVRLFLYFSPDCSHCQELWPEVQKEVAGVRASGLVVGAIAMRGQPREEVVDFAEGLGMDNPLWMDSTGSIAQAFRIHSVPRAFLVSKSGAVQVFRGLTPKRLREILGMARRMALMH